MTEIQEKGQVWVWLQANLSDIINPTLYKESQI